MLCAQYGNPLSYYGNIQLGFYNPPLFTWGAWELPYPQHYQSPLTEKEEVVIEERKGQIAEPVREAFVKAESMETVISRLQHQQHMAELAQITKPIQKTKPINTDDEDSFILM